jgi:DNA-binding response OmpR family regulator
MGDGESITRRRILVGGEIEFSRIRLCQILDAHSFELFERDSAAPLSQTLESLEPRPDLIVLPIDCSSPAGLTGVRAMRASRNGRQVPILGVTTLGRAAVDIPLLRAHGIVGMIERELASM